MKKCVFAGTFDPVTVGHEEIIGKASGLFDEVIVAVCINVNKKTMFPLEKRMKFRKLEPPGTLIWPQCLSPMVCKRYLLLQYL